MSDEKKDRKDEQDKFWDISRLVPQKPKSNHRPSSTGAKPRSVFVSAPSSEKKQDNHEQTITRIAPPRAVSTPPSPIFAEYDDVFPLVPHVKILNWKSTYNYYETFCRQAAIIHQKHGAECREAPFSHYFSYVAQYSQLNRQQLEWYLWWRECVRNGKFLKVDVSYINLLIFEIINLGETVDTKASLDILISLWANYKDDHPQLASTLVEWICDYSLIHKLPISFPDERLGISFLPHTTFPECFYNFDLEDANLFARFLMSACNAYDYRKSKFYTDESKAVYDEYIPRAFQHFCERVDLKEFLANRPLKKLSRTSFTGALCSYMRKKQIEVEYISLRDAQEVKSYISNVIKYAENKVRAYLGIRSRLTIREINPIAAEAIDSYFSSLVTSEDGARQPEYERLYDTSEEGFSLESAKEIERQSWEITERLVEAFEDEEGPPEEVHASAPKPPVSAPAVSAETGSDLEGFMARISRYHPFLTAVQNEDATEQKAFARAHKLLIEAIVDEINEVSAEIFGDILIEEADDGFRIIEDYRHILE